MKALLILLSILTLAPISQAIDFAGHPFFKHLVGEWDASGELKGENNNSVTITENWTGKADAEGSFFIEGSRTINGDTQPFQWTITHNPATDGFEAVLTSGDGSQTIRFEGSLSEVEGIMNMKAITGSGDSSITLQDSFADNSKETLNTKVLFTGDQGQTTLEGTIVHKRKRAP